MSVHFVAFDRQQQAPPQQTAVPSTTSATVGGSGGAVVSKDLAQRGGQSSPPLARATIDYLGTPPYLVRTLRLTHTLSHDQIPHLSLLYCSVVLHCCIPRSLVPTSYQPGNDVLDGFLLTASEDHEVLLWTVQVTNISHPNKVTPHHITKATCKTITCVHTRHHNTIYTLVVPAKIYASISYPCP